MLKFLCTLVLFSLSLSIYAETQTTIVVTPVRPVNCQLTNSPHVNWIYKLTKISENDKESVFEFVTQHGFCENGRVRPYIIDERNASVGLFRDGLVLPWQREGAEATAVRESDSELRVRMVFDKKILFKKRTIRTLSMFFEPGVNYGPVYIIRQQNGGITTWQAKLSFPWKVLMNLDEVTGNSQITIQ